MRIVITGSQGNVGRRLMAAFPGAVGIDRAEGAHIRVDLDTVDYGAPQIRDALATADALLHLATSADPDAPDDVHWQAVANAARLFRACAAHDVRRLVVASSDWAEPKNGMSTNAYGHSKRVLEAMSTMYGQAPGRRAVALRVGWVPASISDLDSAPDWLLANYWSDERLVAQFKRALGLTS